MASFDLKISVYSLLMTTGSWYAIICHFYRDTYLNVICHHLGTTVLFPNYCLICFHRKINFNSSVCKLGNFPNNRDITLRNAGSPSLSFSLKRRMAYELRIQYFK